MLIGYARVSTLEQTLVLQQDALTETGCERIFTNTVSGSKSDRPGLEEILTYVRPADTLLVWQLDRVGRSLRHLVDTVGALQERGIGFKSLQEQIDTTSSSGKLAFHVFGALAEFERDLIRERTRQGCWQHGHEEGWVGAPRHRHSHLTEGADRPGPLLRQEQLDRRYLPHPAHLPDHSVLLHHDRDKDFEAARTEAVTGERCGTCELRAD